MVRRLVIAGVLATGVLFAASAQAQIVDPGGAGGGRASYVPPTGVDSPQATPWRGGIRMIQAPVSGDSWSRAGSGIAAQARPGVDLWSRLVAWMGRVSR